MMCRNVAYGIGGIMYPMGRMGGIDRIDKDFINSRTVNRVGRNFFLQLGQWLFLQFFRLWLKDRLGRWGCGGSRGLDFSLFLDTRNNRVAANSYYGKKPRKRQCVANSLLPSSLLRAAVFL